MKLKSVAIGLVAGVFLASPLYAGQAGPKKITGQSQSSSQSSGAQSDQQSSGKGSGKGSGTHNGGAKTSDIKQIQQKLKDQGFDPGPIDGKMGPKTHDALKQFQQKQGIQPTGRPDQQTMAALGVGSSSGGSQGGAMQGGSSSTPGGSMQGGSSGGSGGGTQGGTSQQSPDMGGGQSNGGSSGQGGANPNGSSQQNGGSSGSSSGSK